MNIVFHGHSFVEIETYGGSILIDPFVQGNPACDLTLDDLMKKPIRAIVVTHGHDDHLGETVPLSQVSGAPVITTYELAKYLSIEKGLDNVSGHGIGGGVQYDGFHVTFFQAWHGGGITSYTHGYTTVAAGVIIKLEDKTLYHAGDTGLFGDMKLLNELYTIDVAFLPIGDRYTMGVEHAAIATKWIKPQIVVPMHYDTWKKISADTDLFTRLVAKKAKSVRVEVMKSGDVIDV